MSVQLTDANAVVIYDSVTGKPIAGLPAFESEEHAQDFLRYLGYDPRQLDPATADRMHSEWWGKRVDAETGLLRPVVLA
jgi:hypothetical protein